MDAASAYFATPGGEGFPEANRPADTTVKDIMTEAPIVWVDSNASCAYAASLMLEKNVGLLPVKDPATDALLGVLTDRDLIVRVVARALDAAATPVGAVMSGQSVALVYEDADIVAAERLMIDRGVRRLPVTRRADNEVVGIISVDDFAMAGFRRRAGEIIRGSLPGVAPVRGLDVPAAVGEATAPSAEAPYVTPSVYTVADVMTGLPELVRDTQTCRDAAARMEARSVGFLVVCSDGAPARVRGVVTDRDLVVRVLAFNRKPETVLVGDAMSLDVVACLADSNLADAESLMIERGVRRLPVLRRETGELVGVVSVDDLAVAASRSRAGRVLENVAQAPTLDGGAADETALKAECASLRPPPAVGAGVGAGAGAGAGADSATGTA